MLSPIAIASGLDVEADVVVPEEPLTILETRSTLLDGSCDALLAAAMTACAPPIILAPPAVIALLAIAAAAPLTRQRQSPIPTRIHYLMHEFPPPCAI
ncbi:MAG: hypothetical protein IPN42_09255 [Methylococcaceae bacterium]|nr:hypothetical protein [Methylococcaceae bacterium]